MLEAIVGLDCLPRNATIATRRPLLLKLQAREFDPKRPEETQSKAVIKGKSFGEGGQIDFERAWPGIQKINWEYSTAISCICTMSCPTFDYIARAPMAL